MKWIIAPIMVVFTCGYLSVVGYLSFIDIIKPGTNSIFGIALSFFLGNSLILMLYRVFDFFIKKAKISLYITSGISVLIVFVQRSYLLEIGKLIGNIKYTEIATVLLIVIIFSIIYFCVYNDYTEDSLSVWTCIGTPHTARTTNMAYYIRKNNEIPIFGQSYGQALFVSIFEVYGMQYSFLILFCYSVICCTTYFFFLVGILQMSFQMTYMVSILSSIAIFMGSESFRKRIQLISDSAAGTISQITIYPDAAISFCLFVQFIMMKEELLQQNLPVIQVIALLMVITFTWTSSSIQYIILSMGLLIYDVLISVMHQSEVANLLKLIIVLVCFVIFYSRMGGMLAPSKKVNSNMNGQMKVEQSYLLSGITIIKNEVIILTKKWKDLILCFSIPIITYSMFLTFVVLGFIESQLLIYLGSAGMVLLVGGFVIVYPLALSGKKMESNRFIVPTFVISRIILVLLLWEISQHLFKEKWILNIVFLAVAVFLSRINVGRIMNTIRYRTQKYDIRRTFQVLIGKSKQIEADNKFCGSTREEIEIYQKIEVGITDLMNHKHMGIILYGASETGANLLEMLTAMKIKVKCFADRDPNKWKTSFHDLEVISPEEIKSFNQEQYWVIIASKKIISVYKDLELLGNKNIKWVNLFK